MGLKMTINDSTQLTQDTTVTAQYAAQMFTITIVPNGGSGSNKTYSVAYGTNWSVPSSPFSRTGYNFNNYKTGASSGTSYSAGNSIRVTRNITLYCQWSAKTYTVTIYPNGASGSNKTYSVAYGTSWSIPSCPFSRSGYSFNGYRTSSSSGTSYSAGSRITISGNLSLYCQWVDPLNSIKFTAQSDSYYRRFNSTTSTPQGTRWNDGYDMNVTLKANMSLSGITVSVYFAGDDAFNTMTVRGTTASYSKYDLKTAGLKRDPNSEQEFDEVRVKLTNGSRTIEQYVSL